MIYVTGDVHGDPARLSKKALSFMKDGDVLIVCGDFGFVWSGSESEKRFLKKLGDRPYMILFADGTHENFGLLEKYPVTEFMGGYAQNICGSVWHLMRGEVYQIERRRVFVMGGGSPDPLLTDGEPDEDASAAMPSQSELMRGAEKLEAADMNVDIVITHCPPNAVRELLLPGSEGTSEVTALSAYLRVLSAQLEYSRWYFGSLHLDRHVSSKQTAVFKKIYEAYSGREAG